MEHLPTNLIIISERDRTDYGDLEELSASINRYGLLQPVLIDDQNNLIAGGRRLAACKLLDMPMIPVYRREKLSEAERKLMETEENVRRKAYNWREEVSAIKNIHFLHKQQAAVNSEPKWTQGMTAELIGYTTAYVSYCLDIAENIADPVLVPCETLTEAIRALARKREDWGRAQQAERTNLQRMMGPAETKDDTTTTQNLTGEAMDVVTGEILQIPNTGPVAEMTISLSDKLFLGDCRQILSSWPEACVDHIICDPPYAIDMDMLQQASSALIDASRVSETHQVEPNLQLLRDFLPLAHRIMKPTSYMVLWCDIMNWQFLYDLAKDLDFKVQRWPIVWHKTSPCKNHYASVNFTKNTEIAMVLRREKGAIYTPVGTSVITCGNDAERQSNPFAKPYELWRFLLESLTHRGQTILDPFAGEGSSLITGYKLLRRMVGIECDEKHFNVQIENVKNYWKTQFQKVTFK